MRKKEFTSFDTTAVIRELEGEIRFSRVSNIYQLNSKTFLFKLHRPDVEPLNLVIEAGRRLHLTSYDVAKPEKPPAFCMTLRSKLRNARLEEVVQHEFERVVIFSFRTGEGLIKLVLEVFGEGNIIMVSVNGETLQALTYKRMRDRNILRGELFCFAPPMSRNPSRINETEFGNALKIAGDTEVVRALTRTFGVGGVYSEEILLRAGVEKTRKTACLSEEEVGKVFYELDRLLEQVKAGVLEPCIVLDNAGSFTDVLPVKLRVYGEGGFTFRDYGSFNEALDEFYARLIAVQKATAGVEVEELRHEAERLGRVLKEQEETVAEAERKVAENKVRGDLIYTYSAKIQALLNRFAETQMKGENMKMIAQKIIGEAESGVGSLVLEGFDGERMLARIRVDGADVVLDVRRSLYENAGGYYERSKREKQRIQGANSALQETRGRLAEVEEKIARAETVEHAKPAEAVEDLASRRIKHKEWFEKFRWFRSSDGFLVVAGKDAVSNEVLIKKYAGPEDIVFHADISGAPFVVVKTDRKEPSEQVISEAGEFAASFSKGWREGFASIDVYWVKPDQLTKTAPSGEFVAHGAFVVTGKRNWRRNTPLTTAIGVVLKENGEVEFVGGPVDTVKAATKVYVALSPGEEKGKELIRKIINALAEKLPKEQKDKAKKASVEEIREYVPYGLASIIQK